MTVKVIRTALDLPVGIDPRPPAPPFPNWATPGWFLIQSQKAGGVEMRNVVSPRHITHEDA